MPLSPDERRARRLETFRRYKAKVRADAEVVKQQTREQTERCYDMRLIEPRVIKTAEGCWLWPGPYRIAWQNVRAFVRVGEYGRECVDNVIYRLKTGKKVPRNYYLVQSCGRGDCVAPDHFVLTNRVVERAKARRRHGEEALRQRAG